MNKVNAATPRLSDEEADPLEQDDTEHASHLIEGMQSWNPEDINDIRNLIEEWMPPKQQQIFHAFLEGLSYSDIGVTEKYWRYHFAKGIEFIRKELKL